MSIVHLLNASVNKLGTIVFLYICNTTWNCTIIWKSSPFILTAHSEESLVPDLGRNSNPVLPLRQAGVPHVPHPTIELYGKCPEWKCKKEYYEKDFINKIWKLTKLRRKGSWSLFLELALVTIPNPLIQALPVQYTTSTQRKEKLKWWIVETLLLLLANGEVGRRANSCQGY
jgi:hypothetical protein